MEQYCTSAVLSLFSKKLCNNYCFIPPSASNEELHICTQIWPCKNKGPSGSLFLKESSTQLCKGLHSDN